jgi:hypothetical protein
MCSLCALKAANKDTIRYSIITPLSIVLLKKLLDAHLINKFPAFYGTRHWSLFCTTHNRLNENHSNIILPSILGYAKQSFPFMFSDKNSVGLHMYLSLHCLGRSKKIRNILLFYGEELLAPHPNTQAVVSPLISRPRQLIQHFLSCHSCLQVTRRSYR